MSKYLELRDVDVSDKVEKKNNLSYLSWAWAVDTLLQHDPAATWSYGEPVKFGETMMVFCTVSAFGKSMTAHLPVMDHRNKAISNPDAFAVNTAMMRCLAKGIALHGLGLKLYAGEDLWDEIKDSIDNFDLFIAEIKSTTDPTKLKEVFAKSYTALQKNKALRDKLTEVYNDQKDLINAPSRQPALQCMFRLWKTMGSASIKEQREPSHLAGQVRCVFYARSSSRRFGIWIFKRGLGWRESGVVVVRLIDQLVVLSW